MKTYLHTDPQVFEQLAGRWDDLVEPGRSNTFFSHLTWQKTWWQYLQRGDLLIIAVQDDAGNLLGIAPWFIEQLEHKNVIRFIGCVDVTDYMDIVAHDKDKEAVLQASLDFLLGNGAPPWDLIDLCNLPESSPTVALLPRLAANYGLEANVAVQEVCPEIVLPTTYEDYLSGLDKKQRHELRRKRRRAEASDVSWYMVRKEHNLVAEVDSFLDLMAKSNEEKAAFLEEPGHRVFFEDLGQAYFETGELSLIFLTIGGQKAAAMWQFAYRDRMLLYNSGLDPVEFSALSPGIVLLTYSIEDAISRGFRYYDFLRGGEDYKYRMGAVDTQVFNIVIGR